MKNGLWMAALAAGLLLPGLAVADSSILRFKGGIGVIPVSSGQGGPTDTTSTTVNRNFVRGVPPAGQIWVIADLDARISAGGQIRVRGRGLLLGGGNNIGGSNNANVFATLICQTAAPFTQLSSDLAGVQLDDAGDFRIDDELDAPPPAQCASPVLLIRNAANGSWFAAGIPQRDD
jgi:hypothetical protein